MDKYLTLILESSPPSQFAYLGAHPILCAFFGTQNPLDVSQKLKIMSTTECSNLMRCMNELTKNPKYPHASTVWQFNNVDEELGMFFSYLQPAHSPSSLSNKILALNTIQSLIETHCITYPFIDISYIENALDFMCESEQSTILEDTTPQQNPLPSRPKPQGVSSILIPSIALGSLFLAKSLAKDF